MDVVMQWVSTPLQIPTSLIVVPGNNSSFSALLIQLPANLLSPCQRPGWSSWFLVLTWQCPGYYVYLWLNQQREDTSVCLLLSSCHSTFQEKKRKKWSHNYLQTTIIDRKLENCATSAESSALSITPFWKHRIVLYQNWFVSPRKIWGLN